MVAIWANRALFPLIYGCKSRDIVVVHVNPTERFEIPKTAQEIINRINEISFNSSLFREMRAIAFVTMKWSRLSEQIFRIDKWSLCQG
jgi:predicted acylesterase/phospholipase RssA